MPSPRNSPLICIITFALLASSVGTAAFFVLNCIWDPLARKACKENRAVDYILGPDFNEGDLLHIPIFVYKCVPCVGAQCVFFVSLQELAAAQITPKKTRRKRRTRRKSIRGRKRRNIRKKQRRKTRTRRKNLKRRKRRNVRY